MDNFTGSKMDDMGKLPLSQEGDSKDMSALAGCQGDPASVGPSKENAVGANPDDVVGNKGDESSLKPYTKTGNQSMDANVNEAEEE